MSSQPLRLQLAIQGGGAKICALLAAAECVEEFVNRRQFEITRFAGTSAGAIVACLLAAEVPIGEVRQRLRAMGDAGLRRLFPSLGRIGMCRRFFLGHPFWGTGPLQDLLAEFFDRRGLSTLGDIKSQTGKTVFITASDITNERRLDYCHDSDPIVNSLIFSCSMPYVFSAYKNCGVNAIVDGGICENLPIDVLKEGEDEWGQVIGISFYSRPRKAPRSLRDFSLALLNTSINNSMMRAKESIGAKRVFQIITDIDTLDFGRALGDGLGENHYGRIKLEAEKFFASLTMVQQPQGAPRLLVGDPWQGDNVETMKKMGRVYRAQHEPIKLEYESIALIVHANSLFPVGRYQHGLPDLIEQRIIFRPHDQSVGCHRLIVGSTTPTDFPGRLSCIVRNAQGKEHPSEVIPSRSEESALEKHMAEIKREILVFFIPQLPAGKDAQAPYTIVMRDCLRGAMSDLQETGESLLGTGVLRAAIPAKRVDLVLLVPEDYQPLEMISPEGGHVGRAMDDTELANFYVPDGFRALGWTGSNVLPDTYLKVKIVQL